MTFSKWSQLNPGARKALSPDFGIRSWDEVDSQQKEIMWLHFINKGWFDASKETYRAVNQLNEDNKARSFCNHLQKHGGPHYYEMHGASSNMKPCCFEFAQKDFCNIFYKEVQDVFYELLSYYVPALEHAYQGEIKVAKFRNLFNDISNQFGLNVLMNEGGFILRQDEKITEGIYIPVLNYLNDEKWRPVNRDLGDAMTAYLKNTEESYSASITLAISALQGFMQIIVNGKTGKGDLGNLIMEAQSKNLIPSDPFATRIFKDIQSILMQERQEKGHPHPKQEYANEKSTKLVLNLVMIFMQHCLQK